jgi:hypothetical protein
MMMQGSFVKHGAVFVQADDAAKKKRTFRKFTYRGVDLDQLLDMTT